MKRVRHASPVRGTSARSSSTPPAVPALRCTLLPSAHGLRFPAAAHAEDAAWEVFRSTGPGSQPKEQAYEAAKARVPRGAFGGPLPIISWQKNAAGTREYTVTSWPAFWDKYSRLHKTRRRHYEIVRSGLPCKLFVDIDERFAPGDARALAALRARTAELAAWISAQLEAQPEWRVAVHTVMWLDASAPARGKFSVHLVWNLRPRDAPPSAPAASRMPDETLLFESPAAVLALVEWLHARAIAERVACWWQPAAVPDVAAADRSALTRAAALVDFSVHTAGDREFRLLYATKPPEPGKPPRHLKAVEFAGGPEPPREGAFTRNDHKDGDTFFASLITYVDADTRVVGVLEAAFADPARVGTSGRLLGLPGDARSKGAGGRLRAGGRTSRLSHLPGRLKALLEYVRLGMEDACPDAATLHLQRYYDDLWCAVFRSTNRYCELQGRDHKSNGVYYVCWLGTGRFYQRCHDPECAEEYRADLAAEVRERALAYASVKAEWTAEERAAEEAYLAERRALAGNAELRARGEVYTLQPELRVAGRAAPVPLWALLTAYRRQAEREDADGAEQAALEGEAGEEGEDEGEDGEAAEPAPKKPRLSFASSEDENEAAAVTDALDRALAQDVDDGLDALFA